MENFYFLKSFLYFKLKLNKIIIIKMILSKYQHNLHLNSYFKEYLKDLLILAIPLFIGNLGHTLIGATDVLVVARYGINSLAAIGIANSIIFTIFILGIGIITAVSIVLSHLRGTGVRIKKHLPTVLVFSLFLSLFFSIICFLSKYLIPFLGFEKYLVQYIQEYIEIVAFSMFGIFLFEGIKQFLQAYEIVKLPNIIIFVSVIVNLIFDIALVFGYGFIPAMGSKGAAIATFSVRTLTGLFMLLAIIKHIDFKNKLNFSFMKQVLKVGIPIGIGLMFEFLAFNIITILIGREASIYAAVHSILITISSATFMVPMAISTALSVKVAYYFGSNSPIELKKYSYTGLIFGVGFMCIAAIILTLFPQQIIELFTDKIRVINIAIPLIPVVASYQIFDGCQCITGGILKGFKKTKTVTVCVIVGYWLFGAPIAYLLVYKYNLALKGFWIALAMSLCIMSLIQSVIAKHRYKLLLSNK